MPYDKPFRELSELTDELRSLGLRIDDEDAAARFLRRVGYYRSGGYRYAFRQLLPPEQRNPRTRTFREDRYVPGSSIADVERLERFDSKLREVCQAGLLEFELRARAAIAHTLARRNVFAHTSTSHLDAGECAKPGGPTRATKFEQWERTYLDAIGLAASEDFIAHLLMKYGHPLPIWATVDVLSFGNLPYRFELMLREDRIEVARAFGVKQDRRFGAWLRSMVDFRNYCAHGARLFNRHFKRDISVVQGAIDPALLGHVIGTDFSASDAPQSRLYVNAALLAYMLRRHSSGSTWHRSFRTQARKLPVSGATGGISLTAERDMGFPADWESEQLWQ